MEPVLPARHLTYPCLDDAPGDISDIRIILDYKLLPSLQSCDTVHWQMPHQAYLKTASSFYYVLQNIIRRIGYSVISLTELLPIPNVKR